MSNLEKNDSLYDQFAVKYQVPDYRKFISTEKDKPLVDFLSRCTLFIEYRGNDLWCVKDDFGTTYSMVGSEYESLPSSRTDDYLKNFRFSKEEAFKVAATNYKEMVLEYISSPGLSDVRDRLNYFIDLVLEDLEKFK
jgi:hypothetical protein